jgi:hypothetical protein
VPSSSAEDRPAEPFSRTNKESTGEVYRLLTILEIRPASSHTERRRIHEEGVYEFWTLKSSIKVPTIDGSACDSAVIIVLQVQFLYTCYLKQLKVFIPYLAGEEVYDWTTGKEYLA